MPLYESTFIARPDISGQQAESLSEQFQGIVREKGGTIPKSEYWGLRNLSYRIKKSRKGHYMFMNIDAPAEAILEMERNMRINEDVMRYLTIRVDELDPNPSAPLQSRGSRDGRDSRGRGDYRGRSDRRPSFDRGSPPKADDRGSPPKADAAGDSPSADGDTPSADDDKKSRGDGE